MKLLCLCSALDLSYRYGCTPAWWQLFKGLYECGHEVVAVPYQGAAIESPWWRVYPNPCRIEGEAYAALKRGLSSLGAGESLEGVSGGLSRGLIASWVRPRWEGHVLSILDNEKDVDAVIVFTIPMNHLTGIPAEIRHRYSVPVIYYDGDVPASLPRFGGFASGFRIYDDASPKEYNGFMCNSLGGAGELREMGAPNVETIYWGVDPELYAPLVLEEDRDVYFYGFGSEYREQWMRDLIATPSRELGEAQFAVGGKGFDLDLGKAEVDGDVPFSVFRQACLRSRINLNITRDAHASVFASSSMRIFELAAMGCCIVSNPCAGMETWFDLEHELMVVNSAEEAIATYRMLLADDGLRRTLGEAARARVLSEHTHRDRAEQLVAYAASF